MPPRGVELLLYVGAHRSASANSHEGDGLRRNRGAEHDHQKRGQAAHHVRSHPATAGAEIHTGRRGDRLPPALAAKDCDPQRGEAEALKV